MKPDNLLIDENNKLIIADFGFAAPIEGRHSKDDTPTGFLYTSLGTRNYMAPEVLNSKQGGAGYRGD